MMNINMNITKITTLLTILLASNVDVAYGDEYEDFDEMIYDTRYALEETEKLAENADVWMWVRASILTILMIIIINELGIPPSRRRFKKRLKKWNKLFGKVPERTPESNGRVVKIPVMELDESQELKYRAMELSEKKKEKSEQIEQLYRDKGELNITEPNERIKRAKEIKIEQQVSKLEEEVKALKKQEKAFKKQAKKQERKEKREEEDRLKQTQIELEERLKGLRPVIHEKEEVREQRVLVLDKLPKPKPEEEVKEENEEVDSIIDSFEVELTPEPAEEVKTSVLDDQTLIDQALKKHGKVTLNFGRRNSISIKQLGRINRPVVILKEQDTDSLLFIKKRKDDQLRREGDSMPPPELARLKGNIQRIDKELKTRGIDTRHRCEECEGVEFDEDNNCVACCYGE